jgi:hypothetical protein
MHLKHLRDEGKQQLVRGLQAVEAWVKTWTEPAPDRAIKGVVTDLFPSRKDLIAENAFLRQQVIVLKRKTWEVYRSRSRIAACWWCWRISCVGWKDALHIVKPDTLVKWHRQGLRLFWRRKSQGQTRRTAHFGEWVEEAGKRKPVWRILPELLYGQFSKVRAGRKLKQVYTKMLCGERSKLQAILQGIGLSGQIQTAFVERLNLTLRHLVAALRRKDLGVSGQRAHLTLAGSPGGGLLQLLPDASLAAGRDGGRAIPGADPGHGVGGDRAPVERTGIHHASGVLGR